MAALVLSFLVIGYAFLMAETTGELKVAISDLGLVLLPLITFASSLVAARKHTGRGRQAWILMGVSALSWGIGETIWSYYELALGREVPFPSLADAGYLAAVPLAGAALLSFPSAPTALAGRVRGALDGLIIAGSLLCLSWVTIIGPTYRAGGTILEKTIGLAYPLGDVALVTLVLFVAVGEKKGGRGSLALLGAGLLSFVFADSAFSYLTLNDLYASGNPIDIGWAVGYAMMALAAIASIGPRSYPLVRSLNYFTILLPYASVGLALSVLVQMQVTLGSLEPFVVWNGLTVFFLVVIRQLVTLIDNVNLNRRLEARVEERTAQLSDALEELAESSRLQDQFVANTSHELRTPITVILGSLQTLRRPQFGIEGAPLDLVEGAERNTVRMKKLVEDLLLTSSMTSSYREPPARFAIEPAVQEAIAAVKLTDKNVEITVEQGIAGMGHLESFRKILEHLFSNADKFAPSNSTIWITGRDEGSAVGVMVTDEGPGIPRGAEDLIFRRFVQLDGSSTRVKGGMGVGLFLARRLAESMGGTLEIGDRSSGATFHLSIPSAGGEIVPSLSRPKN